MSINSHKEICVWGIKNANREIMPFFKNIESSYELYVNPIKKYEKRKLDSTLPVATYYLNPFYYYRDFIEIKSISVIMDYTFISAKTFYPNPTTQDNVIRIVNEPT